MNQRPLISGVILGGGASRRMGQNKLNIEIDGQTLLSRVRSALAAVCDDIILVGGDGLSGADDIRRVSDLRPGMAGPLSGVEAGLTAVRHPTVFMAAGDLPFLNSNVVSYLCARIKPPTVAAVPLHGGRKHPLCAAYRRDTLATVSAVLDGGTRSMKAFLRELASVEYVKDDLYAIGDPEAFLMNVNSPEDLQRARTLASSLSQ